MSADQKDTTPKQEKKPNVVKDLPAKEPSVESTDKIKGGIVGPCNSPRGRG